MINEMSESKSICFKFCGQYHTMNDSPNYISFINDDYFVKRLKDNFVAANIYDLKNAPYNERWRIIERISIRELSRGTNVQFAEGQVYERDALNSKKRHHISDNAIRFARATLAREHTDKINGNYILLVHPDIAERLRQGKFFCDATDEKLKNDLKGRLIGEILDVIIVEMEQLPIYKNSKGEDIYCSFLFGDYAFGIKYFEKQAVCGIRRINEKHMVRIETVA